MWREKNGKNRNNHFLSFQILVACLGWMVSGIYRRFIEGFSMIATMQLTWAVAHLDTHVWAEFYRTKNEVDQCVVLIIPEPRKSFRGLLWCFLLGIELCAYIRENSGGMCFKVTEDSWEELSYSWLGVGRSDVCLEDMETLSLWCINSSI